MEPVAPQATGVEQAQLIAAQETASQTMAAAMTEVAASPRRQPKQPAPLVHTLNILARDAGIGRVNTTCGQTSAYCGAGSCQNQYGRCDDGSGCVAAPRIATTTETATETPGPTPTPVVNDCDYAPTVPGKSLRARWIRAPSKNSSGLTDCTGLYDAPSRGSYSVSYPSRNGSVPARFAAEVHPAPADNTDCACVGPVHKNTYLNLYCGPSEVYSMYFASLEEAILAATKANVAGSSCGGITKDELGYTLRSSTSFSYSGHEDSWAFNASSGCACWGSGFRAPPEAVNFGLNPFTINLWVKTNSTSTFELLSNRRIAPSANSGDSIMVWGNSTHLVAELAENDEVNSVSVAHNGLLIDGNWHMMTFTREDQQVTLILDANVTSQQGDLGSLALHVGFDETSPAVNLGGQGYGVYSDSVFAGQVDDIRIYNDVLSTSDVSSLFVAAENLDGYTAVKLTNGSFILAALISNEIRCFGPSPSCLSRTSADDLWAAVANTSIADFANPVLCDDPQMYSDPSLWCAEAAAVLGRTGGPTFATKTTSSITRTPQSTSTSRTVTTSYTQTNTKSKTKTTTFTYTTRTDLTTTATPDVACTSYPELCVQCGVSTLFSIHDDTEAQNKLSPGQYQVFRESVAGGASSMFAAQGSMPPLIVGIYKFQEVCFQVNDATSIGSKNIFSRPDFGLNFADYLCDQCIGGLPSVQLKKLIIRQNKTRVLEAAAVTKLGNFTVVPGIDVVSGELNITYDLGSKFVASAAATINSPLFGAEGPKITLQLSKNNLTAAVDLSPLKWSVGKLINRMSISEAATIPYPSIQNAINKVGTLKKISGTMCANITNTTCKTSLSIVASLYADISLGGNFSIKDLDLEIQYNKEGKTQSVSVQLSTKFNLAGTTLDVSGEYEVPINVATNKTQSRRRRDMEPKHVFWGPRKTVWEETAEGVVRRSSITEEGKEHDGGVSQHGTTSLSPVEEKSLAPRGAEKKFTFTLSCSALPVGKLLAAMVTELVPSEVDFITKKLATFTINNFILQAVYVVGGNQWILRSVGTPSPLPDFRFEMVGGSFKGTRVAAMAVVVEVGSLASIKKMLTSMGKTGVDFNTIPLAPQDAGPSAFGIVAGTSLDLVSNKDWKWQTPQLQFETTIEKGFTVAADFGFPADCKGDTICTTFKGFVGNARLRVAMRILSSSFSFSAMLVNLKINDKFTLNKAGLEVTLGTTTKFAVVGELQVKVGEDTTLTFGAEVAAIFTPPKVELKGYMKGMWTHAFGIDRFAVGNLVLGLGVSATSPIAGLPMPAFVIGGEVSYGPQPCSDNLPTGPQYKCAEWTWSEKRQLSSWWSSESAVCAQKTERVYSYAGANCACRCCELDVSKAKAKCIGGAGYVGFDPADYRNNWFSLTLKNLNIQNIFSAFSDDAPTLPSVIGQTGFVGDASFSFSPAKDQEPIPGLLIPQGIFLKGSINFLGYVASLEVKISTANGLYFNGVLSPLTIGGDIFKLWRSSSNPNQGPYLTIDAYGPVKRLMPEVHGSGYLSLFGNRISLEVSIDITVPNNLKIYFSTYFFGFSATLSIQATLDIKGWDSMGIGATVEFSGIDKFAQLVLSQISAWAKQGADSISDAQKKVNEKKDELWAASNAICDATAEYCVDRRDTTSECDQETWFTVTPKAEDCSWWDAACWARVALQKAQGLLNSFKQWACKAWKTVVKVVWNAACQTACWASKATAEVASVAMDVANGALEVAKQTSRAAASVANWLSYHSDVFLLNSMTAGFDFRVSGSKGNQAKFDVHLVGSLKGNYWTADFEIDFFDLVGSAWRLFKQSVKELLDSWFVSERDQLLLIDGTTPSSGGNSRNSSSAFPYVSPEQALADPKVRAWLAAGQYYAAPFSALLPEYEGSSEEISMDLRMLDQGAEGFFANLHEQKEGRAARRNVPWKRERNGQELLDHLDQYWVAATK